MEIKEDPCVVDLGKKEDGTREKWARPRINTTEAAGRRTKGKSDIGNETSPDSGSVIYGPASS
jgi:hypothetical protein